MAQTVRARVLRRPTKEHEIHLFNNPLNDQDQNTSSLSRPSKPSLPSKQRERISGYDYVAPLTAYTLRTKFSLVNYTSKFTSYSFDGF